MTKHKTDMKITKTEKYKKLNMREHEADMSITEKLSITFTTESKTEYNYTLVNQIREYQTSNLLPEKVNENIQSTTNKYTLFIPVTEKSEERKTI